MSTLVRAIAVAVCFSGAALFAQRAGDPVVLDVVVDEASQRQAAALTAADFTVTDDGESLPIESVRLVQPSAETAPLQPVSTDDDEKGAVSQGGRLVGVYVDEYHLENDAAFAAARDALAAFLRSSLGPRDLVVVLKPLDSLLSMRMSADREAAARIVESASPRQGDYAPRSSFEQEFIAGDPVRIDAARNQISLSGVSAIATHLGRFDAGRKTLIVLSNGVSPRAPNRGDAPLPAVESIARSSNRSRVAIYLMRPTRTTAALDDSRDGPPRRDAFEALTAQTTGLVLDGADATASGLQRVLKDASRYYLLTLTPSPRASDGRFRSVSVTLRKPQPAVRARSGYALHRPDDDVRFTPKPLPAGLKIPRRTSPLIRTWFGQSSGADGSTHVDFVWEPSPRTPAGRAPVTNPARVAMRVSTMEGVELYSGTAGPAGTDRDFGVSEPAEMTFSAKPGTLLVQMDILDLAGRAIDHDVRDLIVGGFTKSLSFGTVSVFRSRTNRDFRAIADGTVVAAPVASRQFSRAEHLVFRIQVSSSGGAVPVVTARLLSRFGAALLDLPVGNAPSSTNVFQVDLPLAAFASGGYMLEFSGRSSDASAIDRIEFTVTP